MQGWSKDMGAHQVEYDDGLLEKLDASVQEELRAYDPRLVEQPRDELTVKLLKKQKGASMLV